MNTDDAKLSHRDKILKRISGKVIDTMYSEGIFNSCLTCNHFNEQVEICKLNGLRPPARIIVNGCEKYDDEIPF